MRAQQEQQRFLNWESNKRNIACISSALRLFLRKIEQYADVMDFGQLVHIFAVGLRLTLRREISRF